MKYRIALAAMLLLFAGCHNNDKNAQDKTNPAPAPPAGGDTASQAVAFTDVDSVTIVPLAPQDKPEEGQYTLINRVFDSAGTRYIEADYIRFLMGDEALAAAKKKGEEEMVQDDYYVVNDNKQLRTLKLSKPFEFIDVKAGTDSLPRETAIQHLQSVINAHGILILH